MKSLVLTGAFRRLLIKLHRWSGLALLVCLVIVGVTGSVLAFGPELDRWLNPHMLVVTPGPTRVPMDEVIAKVEAQYPGSAVSQVLLGEHPDDALAVYLDEAHMVRTPHGGGHTMSSALPFNAVFVNPFTGDILGHRSTSRIILTREHIMPLTLQVHYCLLMGGPGMWFMGAIAVVWLLTNLIGLALSWPGAWHRLRSWVPIFSVRAKAGSYKVNYDLHRVGGVVLTPLLLVLAFTSIYLNMRVLVIPLVAKVAPLSAAGPRGQGYGPADPTITPDQAMAAASRAVPGARLDRFSRDFRNGWYTVRLQLPGDPGHYGNNLASVDFMTGEVKALRLAANDTAGDRFLNWQLPLHAGRFWGILGQILVAFAGVVLVMLNGTGFYVWWRKWSPRRRTAGAAAATAALRPDPAKETGAAARA